MAAIVSEIACIDFPDNWTGLFDQLLSMMGTGEPNQVHGVMKVLSELASDITDSQVISLMVVLECSKMLKVGLIIEKENTITALLSVIR